MIAQYAKYAEMFALILVCGFICISTVCRVNMLDPKIHSQAFSLMYVFLGLFSGGVLADALEGVAMPTRWCWCALLSAALNIWLSKDRWEVEAPWQALKRYLRKERRAKNVQTPDRRSTG